MANFSKAIFTFNCFSSEECKTKIVNVEISAVKIIVKTENNQRPFNIGITSISILGLLLWEREPPFSGMPVYSQYNNNYWNEMLIVSNQLWSIDLSLFSTETMRIKPSPSTMENPYYKRPMKVMFSVMSVCLFRMEYLYRATSSRCTEPFSHPSSSGPHPRHVLLLAFVVICLIIIW